MDIPSTQSFSNQNLMIVEREILRIPTIDRTTYMYFIANKFLILNKGRCQKIT